MHFAPNQKLSLIPKVHGFKSPVFLHEVSFSPLTFGDVESLGIRNRHYG